MASMNPRRTHKTRWRSAAITRRVVARTDGTLRECGEGADPGADPGDAPVRGADARGDADLGMHEAIGAADPVARKLF
jgi:hypothetical protein